MGDHAPLLSRRRHFYGHPRWRRTYVRLRTRRYYRACRRLSARASLHVPLQAFPESGNRAARRQPTRLPPRTRRYRRPRGYNPPCYIRVGLLLASLAHEDAFAEMERVEARLAADWRRLLAVLLALEAAAAVSDDAPADTDEPAPVVDQLVPDLVLAPAAPPLAGASLLAA